MVGMFFFYARTTISDWLTTLASRRLQSRQLLFTGQAVEQPVWYQETCFCMRSSKNGLLCSRGARQLSFSTRVILALAERGDTIYSDRLNHASIVDGAILSMARLVRCPHRDFRALRCLLE